jgi:hypothetical protein
VRFESRDYEAARASKVLYWRGLTPAERIRLCDELRRQAIALHPEWPTPQQRALDLASHIRLSERFERAAITGRR